MEEKKPLPPDSPVNPKGYQFKCHMSRHIADYRLFAVWEIMSAFAGGHKQKHLCNAAAETMADALGCSVNFILWAQKEMVNRGILFLQLAASRDLRTGLWHPPVFAFAQHDAYKVQYPCPPYRFDERGRVIKSAYKPKQTAGLKKGSTTAKNMPPSEPTRRPQTRVM